MPWWMKLYTILFIVIAVSNVIFQHKVKVKKTILLYDILSALYMIFLIFAFWTPVLMYNVNALSAAIALGFIIVIDFYFTIWGKPEQLGAKMPKMSKSELEIAKTISIIFASPAYITGILLIANIL